MKDFDGLIILIGGVVLAIAIFFGYTTTIKKSFKPASEIQTPDSSKMLKEQDQRMDEINERQKRLMEEQKQKIRDMQRK